MSYHVYLFSKQTRTARKADARSDWLEDDSAMTPFTPEERATLASNLALTGFVQTSTDGDTERFENDQLGASALLSARGLYLSATGDGVFEILMFGSEWAGDGDTFAKYDPQENSWEP